MNQQPNILFLMTDQMRGDCIGYAGHPNVKTPYLDSIASTGHFFENAYTTCPSCIAARAALMTDCILLITDGLDTKMACALIFR